MKGFRLYLDEDAARNSVIEGLRIRGVDVASAYEEGLDGHSDEEQLRWAMASGRALYTFNAGDFLRLHSQLITAGGSHAGLIIGLQRFSVGEQLRRILRIMSARSSPEMQNTVHFLSNWG